MKKFRGSECAGCSHTYDSINMVSKTQDKEVQIPQDTNSLFETAAGDSFDNESVEFLSQAVQYLKNPEAMEKYIDSEILRLANEGKSLVKALLTNQHYTGMVSTNLLFSRIENAGISHVSLKLTDECVRGKKAPERDPHGAMIKAEFRGLALVAKIGNRGGEIQNSDKADASITNRYVSKQRQALMNQRNAYFTTTITAKPVRMPLTKAILVMAQWGYGVKTKRMIARGASKDKASEQVYQDCWIVEECNFDETYSQIKNASSDLTEL
jgi:hypothetical protein